MPERLAAERVAAWWIGPRRQPGPVLRECLRAAIAAPSVMNTQPWLFRPHRDGVDLYADRERQCRSWTHPGAGWR